MKLLFLSKAESSPSTRYRALQYFPLLREAGFAVAHLPMAAGLGSYVAAMHAAATSDIVVVLRKTFPAPVLWLLRRLSRRLIFDFDDAVFCNTDGSPSATRMKRFVAMATACDRVFAGNGYLAQAAGMFNQAVSIIPTSVVAEQYSPVADKPDDWIDLVWIGSRSTRKYLLDLLPALRLIAARDSRIRLKVIADFQIHDAGFPVLIVPWNSQTEALELASAHIGVAPMRDDDWSRGKCALKILQYMASGLPVVSSASGVNAEVVDNGKTGFLVKDESEWIDRILELANDSRLRQTFGLEGRKRLVSRYSVQSVFLSMRADLELPSGSVSG